MDNSKCTKCEKTFSESDNIVYCPSCNAYYHIDCWNEHGGCSNKECADYVEPPVYAWSNHEIPKEKQKITIKGSWYQTTSAIFSFFMGIVSIASLVICLLAIPVFGNDSIELAFAIIFGISLASYPIFFGIKLCKHLIKLPSKSEKGKRARKISLLILFPILEAAIVTGIIMLSLLIFTCTFTHTTYAVDNASECHTQYFCTKCEVIQYGSSDRWENYPIKHTYENGKCIYCQKDSREYFITLIKTNGQEIDGIYEITEKVTLSGTEYNLTIEYDNEADAIYILLYDPSSRALTELEIGSTSNYKWLHTESVSGKSYRASGEVSASQLDSTKLTISETNITDDTIKASFAEASANGVKRLINASSLYTQKYHFTISNLP